MRMMRSGRTACATPVSWRSMPPGPTSTPWSSGTPKNEYYLTDMVEHARARLGMRCRRDPLDRGDRRQLAQLAEAEAVLQERLRRAAMAAGVTLIGPDTVFLAADTVLEAEVEVGPYVVFGPGVRRKPASCRSAISRGWPSARRADRPFARFRPASEIGAGAKVGNFVEVKNSTLEPGAKANHLSYIGDARVGAKANIGAGTITCNYDGFAKHRTDIGAGAFIGSNTALVAPLTIGDGAFVGAGSTINRDAARQPEHRTRPADRHRGWRGAAAGARTVKS